MTFSTDNELPVGELDDHHIFRLNKFKHLFYCPNCKRSFDSVEYADKCNICSGSLLELKPEQTEEEIKYRYYCPVCEKNFTVHEKPEKCINCGNKFIHRYTWAGTARTDKLMMKIVDIKSLFRKVLSVSKNLKLNIRLQKADKQELNKTRLPKVDMDEQETRIKDSIEEVIIEQSSFIRPLIRLNPFSRNTEEIPTG